MNHYSLLNRIVKKQQIKFLFYLLHLIIFISPSYSQSSDVELKCEALEKGVNLSNWLEAYWLEDNYPNPTFYAESDIISIKDLGFKSIRLPVSFERFHVENDEDYLLPNGSMALNLVDSVILWTERQELNLIIVNHHGYEWANFSTSENIERLSTLWISLLNRYKSINKSRVFFELYNEPFEVSDSKVRDIYTGLISSIRLADFQYTLIVGSGNYYDYRKLINSQPYEDDNLIYSFHFYEPYQFTHQLLSWTNLNEHVEFPNADFNADLFIEAFDATEKWAIKHDVPVMLGELGVGINADEISRCNWISSIMDIIESKRIPWFYWDIRRRTDSFGFFEDDNVSLEHGFPCFVQSMKLSIPSSIVFSCQNPNFEIFPNPTSSILTMKSHDIFNINIVNAFGTIMLSETADVNHELIVNVEDWTPGMYYTIFNFNGQRISNSWIKM